MSILLSKRNIDLIIHILHIMKFCTGKSILHILLKKVCFAINLKKENERKIDSIQTDEHWHKINK